MHAKRCMPWVKFHWGHAKRDGTGHRGTAVHRNVHYVSCTVAPRCTSALSTAFVGRWPPCAFPSGARGKIMWSHVCASLRIVVLGYTNGPPFLKVVSSFGTHKVGLKQRPVF